MKIPLLTLTALLVLGANLRGQSTANISSGQKFSVQGVIRGVGDSVVPGSEITFHGDRATVVVTADDQGAYHTTLPVGTFTMSVYAPPSVYPGYRFLEKRVRPEFQVRTPKKITFDVTLYPARFSCDIRVQTSSGKNVGAKENPEAWQAALRAACGGADFFPTTSKEGDVLRTYIRYLKEIASEHGHEYSGDQVATNVYAPVLLEYDLFTLEAEHLVYDPARKRAEAKGHVVTTDELGVTRRADSLIVEFDNGHAKIPQ